MPKTLKQARKELINKMDNIIDKIETEKDKKKTLIDKLDVIVEKYDKNKRK